MTQDPHHSSWDAPAGEQPVEPSAGPSHPQVSEQPSVHDRGTGGWAQPGWPAQQPAPPPQPAPPAPDGPYGPYGQGPQPAYGPPPGYGQPPQGYGYAGVPASAAPRGQAPTGAIVLVVLSGLLTLVLSWTVAGLLYVVPAIFSAVALARSSSDPAGARRTTRTGWITFGAVTVLLGLLVVVGVVLLFSYGGGGGGTVTGEGVSV
ncbi:hypothetical protein FHN55_14500 [Streptomyces sp. NP160]|uniref:hypothetical protein n=1 Tax=Streptomyces sp. NP160 TaxID=2586637 RepID=UPI00111A2152|nr:hypothetical protein [Streptomyces sp. NP160]TNM64252.1 hypothetical protein FHN55_14500 [Streptomyces sp. NP160]